MEYQFLKTVRKSVNQWYIPLIIGLIFIAVGIWTLALPVESYLTLTIVFSISFIISGVAEISFSISNRNEIDNWEWTLMFGLVTLFMGIFLLIHPIISFTTLPLFVGFLMLFRSIGGVSFAIDLDNYGIEDWGYLLGVGILGIICSFVLIWNPVLAGATVVIWTGIALITGGAYNVYLSLRLRKLKKLSE